MNFNSNSNLIMEKQSFNELALADKRFSVNKEHLYSQMDGEAIILSLKNGKYYGVNSVGAFIWSTLQNPISFQEIQNRIMHEYDIDEAKCQQEVSSFLEKMVEEDLVKISDDKVS